MGEKEGHEKAAPTAIQILRLGKFRGRNFIFKEGRIVTPRTSEL